MTVKEIKRTVEQVVSTEYIAADGEVFTNKEECEKYEESALFAVSKQLKRLAQVGQQDIFDFGDYDSAVEVFDIQTDEDLKNLRQYLYLSLSNCGYSKQTVESYFTDENRKRYVFDAVTSGHEVLIFWNYGGDSFWVFDDGSLDAYFKHIRERFNKAVALKEPETKSE